MAAPKTIPTVSAPTRRRRPAGEPRRLLLEAAQELFDVKGFAATSTREIAERADVSETLMFRYFGSKPALFREAVVAPFSAFVDEFALNWQSGAFDALDDEQMTRAFVGDLYELFHTYRGLVAMFLHADTHDESALAESGVLDEVRAHMEKLVAIGRDETKRRHTSVPNQDLATRATVAMVAGMAAFGPAFYGNTRPARAKVIDELTETILHGRLHRSRARRK